MSSRALLFLLICWGCNQALAQTNAFSTAQNFAFSEHLFEQRFFQENSLLLGEMMVQEENQSIQDTLHFLRGKSLMFTPYLQRAVTDFEAVSSVNPQLYSRSRLLGAYVAIECRQWKDFDRLITFESDTSALHRESQFLLHGTSLLLQHRFEQFDSLALHHPNFVLFNVQYNRLHERLQAYRQIKYKAPWKAGVLSALVPGLGKAYAGDYGEGIIAFTSVAMFGVQAWEGFRYNSWQSPRFYIFGALATVFYIGNIWGSTLNVKIKHNRSYEAVDRQIMVDLRIPVSQLLR